MAHKARQKRRRTTREEHRRTPFARRKRIAERRGSNFATSCENAGECTGGEERAIGDTPLFGMRKVRGFLNMGLKPVHGGGGVSDEPTLGRLQTSRRSQMSE